MKDLLGGIGLALLIVLVFRVCSADQSRPLVGLNGVYFDTRESK